MVKAVLERNQDATFRTSLVKSTLQIDTNPSYDKVESYFKHLMAECEALAVASNTSTGTSSTTTTVEKPEPKMRPLRADTKQGPPQPPPTLAKTPPSTPGSTATTPTNGEAANKDKKEVPCKYFAKTYKGYKGCARGSKCPFLHSWEGNEREKPSRCLECGGKHMVKDCFNKKGGSPTTPSTPKAPSTTRQTPPPGSSSTTTNKTVRIEEVDGHQLQGNGSNEAGTAELKEVLADVGKMLKAMSVTSLRKIEVKDEKLNARIKAFSKDVLSESETGGLLDSGASHAMRTATEEEYNRGAPVRVTLAGEEERILRQNPQGTVLLPATSGEQQTVQPIVPLDALVSELGCSLRWKPEGLQLLHPQRGHIGVTVRNNCPEVSVKEANRLIKELEANQINKLNTQVEMLTAKLEVLRKEEAKSWSELFKEYMDTGCQSVLQRGIMLCPFTRSLPKDVQAMMVTDFDVDGADKYLKALPLTRRKRKLLLASRDWTVRLYMGNEEENDVFVKTMSKNGKVALDVDVVNSKLWDINGCSTIYKLLIWAAAKGRVSDVLGTPPDSTWTTTFASTTSPETALRRTATNPYGVQELSVLQQHRLNKDLACAMKQLLIWMFASIKGNRMVGFMMEFPTPPAQSGGVSFWDTEEWKAFRGITGMGKTTFDQGAIGHQALRPTTMFTNYPLLRQLDGMTCAAGQCISDSLLSRTTWRAWSGQMKRLVAEAVVNCVPDKAIDEEEAISCGARMSKLTKEQRKEWKRHLRNDHQPYRADCSVCLNAQATGYQHRRRRHPQLYALALDLAGPYKTAGRDLDFNDYKYIMVAAYRCPKEYLETKNYEELAEEFAMDEYVPWDEEEDEHPMEEVEQGEEGSGGEDHEEVLPGSEGPETLEEAIKDITEPPECVTIYLSRPLRRRTKNEVLRASKEILLQLTQTALHVATVHTDRAREFSSLVFKEWLADKSLRYSRTSGGDPAANSTAELGVTWAKARVRALLSAAKADARDWPMAIQHATASAWAKAFPSSPTTRTPATPFGHEVWLRAKTYKGTAEKKQDPTGARWKRGWYRGPSYDVNRGHVIL